LIADRALDRTVINGFYGYFERKTSEFGGFHVLEMGTRHLKKPKKESIPVHVIAGQIPF